LHANSQTGQLTLLVLLLHLLLRRLLMLLRLVRPLRLPLLVLLHPVMVPLLRSLLRLFLCSSLGGRHSSEREGHHWRLWPR
jgi:hypothetical protein